MEDRTSVGQISLDLGVNTDDFFRAIDSAAEAASGRIASAFQNAASKSEKRINTLGNNITSSLQDVGKKIFGYISGAFAVKEIISFSKNAVKSAAEVPVTELCRRTLSLRKER